MLEYGIELVKLKTTAEKMEKLEDNYSKTIVELLDEHQKIGEEKDQIGEEKVEFEIEDLTMNVNR